MCLDRNKKKIGTVRFDIKDNIAKIAIILNPTNEIWDYQNLVLFKQQKTLHFKSANLFFIAEIKKINIASKKLFEKIGLNYNIQKTILIIII